MKQQLSNEWKFHLQTEPKFDFYQSDLWARDFNDSDWRKVYVPNDWAVSYPFDEKNSSGTAYLCGGTGWYRYHFTLAAENVNKHAFICFDGVYKHAKVWCNGYYVGSWQNGYTSFCFDITKALKKDGTENVIAVCVEHEDIADCRWYTGSGIMRPVYIKYTEDACIPDDGVFFYSENNKTVKIDAKVQNLLEQTQNVIVQVQLMEKDGRVVYTEDKKISLPEEGEAKITFAHDLENVHEWSNEKPYLYDLSVKVFADEKCSDDFTTKVGIRELRFDPDKGFFCNGKNVKLKGLCLHEDAGCLGNAVPAEVWESRLKKLMACGCNAIRMSHNPHCDELYSLCDKLGLYVMDEIYDEWINPKNKWTHGHNVYPPSHQGITGDFLSCYEKDVRSFVVRRRNHPCVIMWSIGNEIDYPNDPYCSPKFKEMTGNNDASKPAAERQYNPNHPDISEMRGIAKLLSRNVKLWDTTRPVTLALAFPELSSDTGVIDFLDVIGYNYKEQFYAEDHKRFPEKMFVGSENSHTLEAWQAVKNNEYVAGQFLWTGIDYLGEAKGWPVHGAPFGLLDMAGFEKPIYFQRKAWWSSESFIKVFTSAAGKEDWSENWNYEKNEKVDVRVYTSESEVELFVNGTSKGGASVTEKGYADFTIAFESGDLTAKAHELSDKVSTAGKACALKTVSVENGKNFLIISLVAVDSEGKLCSTCDSLVKADCSGKAVLAGLENGDLADVSPYSVPERKLFRGHITAYVRTCAESGSSTVKFQAEGIKTQSVELKW